MKKRISTQKENSLLGAKSQPANKLLIYIAYISILSIKKGPTEVEPFQYNDKL